MQYQGFGRSLKIYIAAIANEPSLLIVAIGSTQYRVKAIPVSSVCRWDNTSSDGNINGSTSTRLALQSSQPCTAQP
ncbi:MAG: hypothetical protein WBA57_20965 [Elainellaceae cyanobacterium]